MRATIALRLVAATVLLLSGLSAWAASVVPQATAQTGFTLTIPAAPTLVDGQSYSWSFSGAQPGIGSDKVVYLYGYDEVDCTGSQEYANSGVSPGDAGAGEGSFTHAQQYRSYRARQLSQGAEPSSCVNVTTVAASPSPSPVLPSPSPSPVPLTLTINGVGGTGPVELVVGQQYPLTVTGPPGFNAFVASSDDGACANITTFVTNPATDDDRDGIISGTFTYLPSQGGFQARSASFGISNCVAAVAVSASPSASPELPSPSPIVQSPSPVVACPSAAQPADGRAARSPRPGASVVCAATPESPRPARSPRPVR